MDKYEKPSGNSARLKAAKRGNDKVASNNSNLNNDQFAFLKTPASTVSRQK